MPISKKILDEVNKLDVGDKQKELIVSILTMEDEGLRNYTKKYEETIGLYIRKTKEEDK